MIVLKNVLARTARAFKHLARVTLFVCAATAANAQAIQIDIPAEDLQSALVTLADVGHVQLLYSTELTTGLKSPALHGSYTAEAALRTLLQGTGLTYRMSGANTITIEKVNTKGAKLLGPVQVEGVQTAGANGSTDVTATEGTGSYTSGALTIGSKMPLSMRETPQSVSVITQQRMQDQNLTDIASALNQAPGITLVTSNSNVLPSFYSRGFLLNSFQFDGGAPLNYGFNYTPTADLAEYDHVELIRGSDGMFTGAGAPSGAINLVRKRPLDHDQLILEGDVGSWDNNRGMMDASGPLAFAGKLRGRAVFTYQSQSYFYSAAANNHTLLYGVLEADPTPSTLISLGGSFTRQNTVPWFLGLPRYQNGDDLHLPRATCLCMDWNRWDINTMELFARIEQRIGDDWSVKLNLTNLQQSSAYKYGQILNPVNPTTLMGPSLSATQNGFSGRQHLADLTLNGTFDLFSHHHDIVVGGNWQQVDSGGLNLISQLPFSPPNPPTIPVNVFGFNPSSYPEPGSPASPTTYYPSYGQSQYGGYMTLRFQVLDALHLLGGFRISSYKQQRVTQNLNSTGQVTSSSTLRYSDSGVLTPYGGLVYDIDETWSAYANYTDIFQSQAQNFQGPPPGTPLPPVRGDESEIGIKGELLNGALNTSLSLYRINNRNAAVTDASFPRTPGANGSTCCSIAAGNIKSEGVDAEVTGQILPDWQIFAGYTYNFNRIVYNGGLSNQGQPNQSLSPKHLFKLWTTYHLPDDLNAWTVGLGVNAQSSSYSSGTVPSGFTATGTPILPNIPFHFVQGGYAVFSGRIAYQIDSHWNAALNVNNILDKTYYQTIGSSSLGNWYGDPRNFMFTLRYVN